MASVSGSCGGSSPASIAARNPGKGEADPELGRRLPPPLPAEHGSALAQTDARSSSSISAARM